MSNLTESAIETFAIRLFERLGYTHIHAPNIAPDSDTPERHSYDEVLLTERLEKALRHINPDLSRPLLQAAIKEVTRIDSPDLLDSVVTRSSTKETCSEYEPPPKKRLCFSHTELRFHANA